MSGESNVVISDSVVLKEFSFAAVKNPQVDNLAKWLAENALPTVDEYQFWRNKITKDLVIINNDAFIDFCKFSTDVVSRTQLDSLKKTVDKGGLWTEENLPADTLLYTPLFTSDPRC